MDVICKIRFIKIIWTNNIWNFWKYRWFWWHCFHRRHITHIRTFTTQNLKFLEFARWNHLNFHCAIQNISDYTWDRKSLLWLWFLWQTTCVWPHLLLKHNKLAYLLYNIMYMHTKECTHTHALQKLRHMWFYLLNVTTHTQRLTHAFRPM